MRKISLFTFIFVSTSLLSGSYHQTSAIGIDSSSHGLIYDGRVVRRYGNLGSDRKLFNKRYPTGLQARAEPDDPAPKGKGAAKDAPKDAAKDAPKDAAKNAPKNAAKDAPKDAAKDAPKDVPKNAKGAPNAADGDPKAKNPKDAKPKEDDAVPAKNAPKQPKASPVPNQQSPVPPSKEPVASPNTANTVNQDQGPPSADTQTGTPTVATGGLSTAALAGLASIGGVFVLVAGLFAFGQRRKNKEMTKSIVSTSAKAWEQQNSTYEKMEDQAEPIGSYTVIATYTPTLADELDIQPGDKVTILVEFDDGWVQGINETRGGAKGVFPRHCVDMDHVSRNKNIKRTSSMGVYSEKYTEVDLS